MLHLYLYLKNKFNLLWTDSISTVVIYVLERRFKSKQTNSYNEVSIINITNLIQILILYYSVFKYRLLTDNYVIRIVTMTYTLWKSIVTTNLLDRLLNRAPIREWELCAVDFEWKFKLLDLSGILVDSKCTSRALGPKFNSRRWLH